MRSSSSRSVESIGTDFQLERVFCNSGIELQLKNSWTLENPGRRFWSCPNYNRGGYCGFFKWLDPEMCPRSKVIIPRFLKKLDRLEDEINVLKIKEKQLEAELRKAKGVERSLNFELMELKNKQTQELNIMKKKKKKQMFWFGIYVMVGVVISFLLICNKGNKFDYLELM